MRTSRRGFFKRIALLAGAAALPKAAAPVKAAPPRELMVKTTGRYLRLVIASTAIDQGSSVMVQCADEPEGPWESPR